ncbi:hypothetical protein ES703_26742 [subsurface metagenome]
MKDVKSWHENDAFWETLAPMVFREQMWANVPLELDGVISLLKISPRARVLDLCCGPGRHSLELARRGFKVTGVDRTKLYLDEAQRQAEAEGLKIEFVQDDRGLFADRAHLTPLLIFIHHLAISKTLKRTVRL